MLLEKYQPRHPRNSMYFQLVEAHCEQLERVWDRLYQPKYGYWRPYVMDVIYKFLDCGDPHLGFVRVRCADCRHEYILPFSCKCRSFCPSCHQRRVVEFGEQLNTEVLETVPHRQWVFSIPKRLRPYFMYDRKLLAKLSLCAWKVLSEYLKAGVTVDNPVPGCIIAVQTFGELLNFNPHLHILATDGCFYDDGRFMSGITPNPDDLNAAFAAEVLDMLKKNNKINGAVINNMLSWEHSGFSVYCGNRVDSQDAESAERLSRYIVRAPVSQERMTYISEEDSSDNAAKVIYEGKTSRIAETFSALDFLARLVTHIPAKGEQTVRYYGYYSNKSRGIRAKAHCPDKDIEATESSAEKTVLDVSESDLARKRFKKNWARLIQKIYNLDPLECPKCKGKMRVISFIEDEATIKKILKHLDLWLPANHSPPAICPERLDTFVNPHRSYEWWENIKYVSGDDYSGCDNRPYEDEFSQEVPYEY